MAFSRTQRLWRQLVRTRNRIWETNHATKREGRMVAVMRVAAITYRGAIDNSLTKSAAALSYYSLLALGPVVGIVVLLTGTFLQGDPEVTIKRALLFVAPSIGEYVNVNQANGGPYVGQEMTLHPDSGQGPAKADGDAASEGATEHVSDAEVSTALDILIDRMMEGVEQMIGGVNKGGKGIAVSIGGLVLIWIGITLLVAVEGAFNQIWGVRQGRSWSNRIVLYWAVLSLGALLGFTLIGFLSATTVAGIFNKLPMGETLSHVTVFIGPLISFAGLTLLLMVFYQFFPNTSVRVAPAFVGGVVVALLLVANNLFSILYINKVIQIQSLYGSVGIILVLMFGLYLFWAFLLLGGQLTYAVQNAHFLANQRAWNNVSQRTREAITFAAFVLICRRFSRVLDPLSADQIAERLKVPGNIVNESMTRLCELDLVKPLRTRDDETHDRVSFLPSRPLKSLTLDKFRKCYARLGSNEGSDMIRGVDPLVNVFLDRVDQLDCDALTQQSVESLLDDYPATQATAEPSEEEEDAVAVRDDPKK